MFICSKCGYSSPKWFSQCPSCGAIGTAEKITEERKGKLSFPIPKIHKIEEIAQRSERRISTGFSSLDRLLGGGIVKGSFILIGGEPGIGKSTLMLQLASKLGIKVVYASAEESLWQIGERARRLGVKGNLRILSESTWEAVESILEKERPELVIFDSLQTFHLASVGSSSGSISQVKAIADRIFLLSKEKAITSILIGHVTKGGTIAGPKLLEHMVDVVLYFEGEATKNFRILRAVKNRFGPTEEIAVFEMKPEGLIEVENPSGYFLSKETSPGIAVFPAVEGKTPIMLEIQSLVTPSSVPSNPRRFSLGVDPYRVGMLIGVIEKYTNFSFLSKDVYVNVSGGLKIKEPAADLPIVLSLLSSHLGIKLPENSFAFGEISLSGRIVNATHRGMRLKEGKKLGYALAIVPPGDKIEGLKFIEISRIEEIRGLLK